MIDLVKDIKQKYKHITFQDLYKQRHYNPTVIFCIRNEELFNSDQRYKYNIFNHVQLWIPIKGQIVQAISTGLGSSIKTFSSDTYKDENGIRVILPIFCRKNNVSFDCISDMRDQYYNCAHFIRKCLVKLNLLPQTNFLIKDIDTPDTLHFQMDYFGLIKRPTLRLENYKK